MCIVSNIYIKNIASVTLGPDFRRGALDREGKEVTGAVVLMRYGENPLEVIKGIKLKLEELKIQILEISKKLQELNLLKIKLKETKTVCSASSP